MKQNVIRIAYLAAAAGPLMLCWLAVSGRFGALMGLAFVGFLEVVAKVVIALAGALFAALAGVFLYLAYRPRWWGKLLCGFAGVSWIGFSLSSSMMGHPPDPTRWLPAGAGALLLVVAIVHHLLDPSFGQPSPAKGGTGNDAR